MTATIAPAGTRPRRLSARTRKGVLVVHIVSAGAWIGIDVVMSVVVLTAFVTDDLRTRAISYQALELFAVWPMITARVERGDSLLAEALVQLRGTFRTCSSITRGRPGWTRCSPARPSRP